MKYNLGYSILLHDDLWREVAALSAIMILQPDQHFYSITELLASGLTHYKINRLVDEGRLIKLNNKVYENTSYTGEESDFAFVSVYAPKGVICMMSAARHYGLTSFLPEGVDIAIERNMKVSTLPDWPQINIWYFRLKTQSVLIKSWLIDIFIPFAMAFIQRRGKACIKIGRHAEYIH